MSNVGNIDISRGESSLTLRLRHVVAGHPGAVLAPVEVDRLIELLIHERGKFAQKLTSASVSDAGTVHGSFRAESGLRHEPTPAPATTSIDFLLT